PSLDAPPTEAAPLPELPPESTGRLPALEAPPIEAGSLPELPPASAMTNPSPEAPPTAPGSPPTLPPASTAPRPAPPTPPTTPESSTTAARPVTPHRDSSLLRTSLQKQAPDSDVHRHAGKEAGRAAARVGDDVITFHDLVVAVKEYRKRNPSQQISR